MIIENSLTIYITLVGTVHGKWLHWIVQGLILVGKQGSQAIVGGKQGGAGRPGQAASLHHTLQQGKSNLYIFHAWTLILDSWFIFDFTVLLCIA